MKLLSVFLIMATAASANADGFGIRMEMAVPEVNQEHLMVNSVVCRTEDSSQARHRYLRLDARSGQLNASLITRYSQSEYREMVTFRTGGPTTTELVEYPERWDEAQLLGSFTNLRRENGNLVATQALLNGSRLERALALSGQAIVFNTRKQVRGANGAISNQQVQVACVLPPQMISFLNRHAAGQEQPTVPAARPQRSQR